MVRGTCRALILGLNYAHFFLILETEPTVEFESARTLCAPGYKGNRQAVTRRRGDGNRVDMHGLAHRKIREVLDAPSPHL